MDKEGDDVNVVVDADEAIPFVATGYKLVDDIPNPVVLVPAKMVATLEPVSMLESQDQDTVATVAADCCNNAPLVPEVMYTPENTGPFSVKSKNALISQIGVA